MKLAAIYPMLFLFALLGGGSQMHAQEESTLEAPEAWSTERIPFPISFAREIPLVGVEDLKFAPGWSNAEADDYWTYVFVWYVDDVGKISQDSLTSWVNRYYDGLMGANADNPEKGRTVTKYVKTPEGFEGQLEVFDNFFSKEMMVLYSQMTEQKCLETGKTIMRFNMSTRPFDHAVWQLMEEVKVIVDCK